MSKLPFILPELIGEGRTPPRVDRPQFESVSLGLGAQLGRGVNALADSAGRIALNFMAQRKDLQDKEDNLALREAIAGYQKAATDYTDKNVFTLGGSAAAGVYDRSLRTLNGLQEKYSRNLKPEQARLFRLAMTQDSENRFHQIYAHENTQTRKANVAAADGSLNQTAGLFAATANPDLLSASRTLAEDRYQNATGTPIFRNAQLKAFEQFQSEGFVWENGRRLKIVDGVKDPDTEISSAAAEQLHQGLVRRVAEGQQYLQSVSDKFHAARVDYLLKAGMVTDAEKYLKTDFGPYAMSDLARKAIGTEVQNHRAALDIRDNAAATLENIKNAALFTADGEENVNAAGGRYVTPESDQALADTLDEFRSIIRKTGDEDGKIQKTMDAVAQGYSLWSRQSEMRLQADVKSTFQNWQSRGLLDDDGMDAADYEVMVMPDGPVRNSFLAVQARRHALQSREQAQQIRADAIEQRAQAAELRAVQAAIPRASAADLCKFKSLAAAKAVVSTPQGDIDCSVPENIDVLMAGYAQKDRQEVKDYLRNPRINYLSSATILAGLLNEMNGYRTKADGTKLPPFTADLVMQICPKLLQQLEQAARLHPELNLEGKDGDAWMRDQLRGMMLSMQATEGYRWYGKDIVIPFTEYMGRLVDKNGNLTPDGQAVLHGGKGAVDAFLRLGMTDAQLGAMQQWMDNHARRAVGQAPEAASARTGSDAAQTAQGLKSVRQKNGTMVNVPADEAEKREAKTKPEPERSPAQEMDLERLKAAQSMML